MSDKKSDQADNLPAWSIRDVPRDVRTATLTHAKKSGVSIGDYVTQAIREKIKADRAGGRAVAKKEAGPVSVADAGSLIDMISKLSGSGVEIPKGLQRSAVSVLNKLASDVKAGKSDTAEKKDIEENKEG
ncbi:hypothetical protein AA106555_1793 [Neokomagataea thailandica NBRC 106555]|uniref:Uncharacterized protein n=1 Tax=Neokomagataea thailandica NBRC 106555 TaxID=1223520 RepID=A0ABQ0QRZ4_9PROT|nr:hypothetical protein [Neokomagataea thailandica]GBR54725.1 hypothetical protein AA106555_1793 [Neokomagataea thailandica NBRC 106555]